MKRAFRTISAALGLLCLCTAASLSATQPASYATALTPLYGSDAPYTGRLELTVSAAGIVRGYYFSSDGTAMFVPVTGGRSGNSIWFDIGRGEMYHVDGRLRAGRIVGTAFAGNDERYAFTARPEPGAF